MAIASSYVRFEVLFPPEPASGLPLYTRLSPPLRLTTMWIWSSRCERSFPVHPVRSEVTSHSTHVFSLLLVVVGHAGLNHSLDERPGQCLCVLEVYPWSCGFFTSLRGSVGRTVWSPVRVDTQLTCPWSWDFVDRAAAWRTYCGTISV